MMEGYGKILISLVNWYRYEETIQCIKNIQTIHDIHYTISVVDNASLNDSYERIKQAYPEIRVVRSDENRGYAGGHLLNVEYALLNNYNAIWILNSDLMIRKNSLQSLVKAWLQFGDNLYGSITLSHENPDIVDFGGGINAGNFSKDFVYNIYEGCKYDDLPSDSVREVPSLEGCSLFIPIDIIRKYGFMRTDFFLYGEENDYCFRLWEHGVKSLVVRDSVVLHTSSSSFALSTDIRWIMGYYRRRNYLRIMMEHYGWTKWHALTFNNSIVSLFKFFVKCFFISNYKHQNKSTYYINKGTLHAVLGRKKCVYNPNDYIETDIFEK